MKISRSTLRRKVAFEAKSERCYVAFVRVKRERSSGETVAALEAARAIRERDGWRIDCTAALAGTWLPWEPIDSRPRASLNAAKAAIRDYYAEKALA